MELWRDFPARLAAATRRTVVAYDRLGFGRSDPHPGPLPLTFVRDEAVTVVPRLREALRKEVGLDALIPFGHSVGGGMAVTTAAHLAKARWALDAWIETWLDPAFAGWRLDDDLSGVRCPTLALHGDRDEYGSPAHAERIARLVRGPSRAVILDGCGHVPHREEPTRVLDEVTRFLAPRDATSAS